MTLISDIAKIRVGLHTSASETGHIAYLQARNFDGLGRLSTHIDTYINTETDHKVERHMLQAGDVLLASKGFRIFGWAYNIEVGPAIASSMFFILQPDVQKVLPEYLATFFNSQPAQAHFQALSAGSSIPSIRKSEIEGFSIPLPPISIQQRVVELKKAHEHGMDLSEKLTHEKQRLFDAVTYKLIYQQHD